MSAPVRDDAAWRTLPEEEMERNRRRPLRPERLPTRLYRVSIGPEFDERRDHLLMAVDGDDACRIIGRWLGEDPSLLRADRIRDLRDIPAVIQPYEIRQFIREAWND